MTDTLDSILSGQSDALSDDSNIIDETVTQQGEGEASQGNADVQQADPDDVQATEVNGQRMVPHAALHSSREKVKRYTEEVADFRKSNESLQRQVSELLQRIPVPKAEQPPQQQAPDFYENPEAATQHAVQQTVSPQFDQIHQTLMANAHLIAGIKYGDDKVSEAQDAFVKAVQAKSLDTADYQRVINSPNRYAAAVQWFQQHQARAEIGDDPAAFRAKLEAEILAKHGLTAEGGAAQQQQQRQTSVMPSNLAGARNVGSRSGPAWDGPPSLQDIFDRGGK